MATVTILKFSPAQRAGETLGQIRGSVTAGTSALFLMTSDAVLEPVAKGLKYSEFEIIATNLCTDQEKRLRAALPNA
jgi:uncharacterized membrane protein